MPGWLQRGITEEEIREDYKFKLPSISLQLILTKLIHHTVLLYIFAVTCTFFLVFLCNGGIRINGSPWNIVVGAVICRHRINWLCTYVFGMSTIFRFFHGNQI